MATDAILGMGAKQFYSLNGGSTYTEMPDMMEIGAPAQGEFDKIEITPVNPISKSKEYLLGLIDNGDFEAKQYYNKSRFNTMFGLQGTKVHWKIQVPDAALDANCSYIHFDGQLLHARLSAIEAKKPLTIDLKIIVTGPVTFVPGT